MAAIEEFEIITCYWKDESTVGSFILERKVIDSAGARSDFFEIDIE